jgi:glycosyltransferase involved in cell wall biosynthesis
MPSIGLAMIVKNEADNLPRLAASVLPHIDRWTIVDTGSSDGTQDVARRVFAPAPGIVIDDEWRGYGPSRNVALRAARPGSDWVLTVDADDTVHGSIDRAALTVDVDGFEAEYRFSALHYWVPRLVRSDARWEWRGRAHEHLALDRPARTGRLPDFFVEHHADGGNRSDKAERELALLEADWADGYAPDRTAFYLARVLEDSGRIPEAVDWYRRRIGIGGWEEETWYASWRLGHCLLAAGSSAEGCGILWDTWAARPARAEPLWTLAEHYRLQGRWEASWQACSAAIRRCSVEPFRSVGGPPFGDGDRLFVHTDVYRWRMAYEASVAAWWVEERPLGRRCSDYLLEVEDLPAAIRENVQANRTFYRS